MNRFWKTVLAGTAAGAAFGAYMYFRSRRKRRLSILRDVPEERAAHSARGMVMATAGRMARGVGRGMTRVGSKAQRVSKRLKLGRLE